MMRANEKQKFYFSASSFSHNQNLIKTLLTKSNIGTSYFQK